MTLHMRPPAGTTLDDAKDWLEDRLDGGAVCPCCGQFAKVYRRKLHSGMAKALIEIYRAGGGPSRDWVNITQSIITAKGGDTAKLRYWGLAEADPDTQGIWRVTPVGEQWVLGKTNVLSHAEIYNDRLLNLTGDPLSVRAALGSHFDYEELMTS